MRKDVTAITEHRLKCYPEMKRRCRKNEQLWCRLIEETLHECPEKATMVRMRYFEGKSEEEVQCGLPIGRTTYLRWRGEVLATLAAKAAYHTLLRP